MSQSYIWPSQSASTAVTANQGTANTDANAWPVRITDGTHDALVSAAGAQIVDGSAVTQPVSGPLTDTQLRASKVPVSISTTSGASLTANGVAGALDVFINNTSVPVRGNGVDGTAITANTLLISGSDGATQRNIKTTATGVVVVDGSAVTQPISAATLPLPSGASTEATLSTLNGKVPSNLTVTSTRLLVDGSGVTQPVSGTVTVNALTNSSIVKAQLQDNSGTAITVGQKVMASSVPVVVASDQSTLIVQNAGRSKVNIVRNDYSSVNVTTAAYVQLIASTAAATNMIEIFDSSGQTLVLATGAAASEVDQFYINPGGNGQVPFNIPASTRVSIKAVTASATSGYINLSLMS